MIAVQQNCWENVHYDHFFVYHTLLVYPEAVEILLKVLVMFLIIFLICLFCPISFCFLESNNENFCENDNLNFEFVTLDLQSQDLERIEKWKTTSVVNINIPILIFNMLSLYETMRHSKCITFFKSSQILREKLKTNFINCSINLSKHLVRF